LSVFNARSTPGLSALSQSKKSSRRAYVIRNALDSCRMRPMPGPTFSANFGSLSCSRTDAIRITETNLVQRKKSGRYTAESVRRKVGRLLRAAKMLIREVGMEDDCRTHE